MAIDYGTDFAVLDDLPDGDALVADRTNLAYALARRITTPEGALEEIGEVGYESLDVRELVQETLTSADAASWEAAIARICEQDERVDSVSVEVTLARDTLDITIDVTPVTGTSFRFVLAVDSASVALLGITG